MESHCWELMFLDVNAGKVNCSENEDVGEWRDIILGRKQGD